MAMATSPSFSAAPSVRSQSPCQPGFASAAKAATANAVSHNGIDQTKNCRNRIICGVILNEIMKYSATFRNTALHFWKHVLGHPFHPLQGFGDGRSSHVENHRVDADRAIIADVRADLFGAADKPPSLSRGDLLFAIEERALQGDADFFRITSRLFGILP